MKIAIVHDFLYQYGGAERVLEVIKELYPEAPVYTSLYDPKYMSETIKNWEIITPKFTSFPALTKIHKYYTFLLPLFFEHFELHQYDVIISSTAHFAKGILTKPSQVHICYCHTPPRFLYHYETEINRHSIAIYKPILAFVDHYLRIWDFLAAQRVDYFVANSVNVQKRISKFYRREATVIHPPLMTSYKFDNDKLIQVKEGSYFLVVSRLAAYKNIDLGIRVCNELKIPLHIVGVGKEEKRLKVISGATVTFLGQLSEERLAEEYQNCKALLYLCEEDFGMTPIEAMAYGKPIIAYGRGGVMESVVRGETGEFFDELTQESLAKLLIHFNSQKYSAQSCRRQAAKFSKEQFKKQFQSFVAQRWEEHQHA